MGTTLPLNEKDGEISLGRLGERRVSSLESLKNNVFFRSLMKLSGMMEENVSKNPCICRRAQGCIHFY